MRKLKSFILTTLLGGVTVILPVAILAFVFGWIFNLVTGMIQPFTDMIVAKGQMREIAADLTVITIILAVCFVIGLLIRTQLGKFLFHIIENKLLKVAPGYTLVKETVLQIFGNKKSPFSSVALAQIFCNETLATCFITDEHEDGSFSVFVPTGPNPTSGNIFHLKGKYVHPVNVSVEETMRSIISCGAGSSSLIKFYNKI